MTSFRVRELQRLLPDVEELRPLRRALLRGSAPDPDRTWSGSGELQTAGDRLIDLDRMQDEVEELLEREATHQEALIQTTLRAIRCASDGNRMGAARALLDAAALEEARGRHGRAAAFAASAHGEAAGLKDQTLAALALRRRGRAERALGLLGDALRHYGEAFEIAVAVGDDQGSAEAAIGAGNVLEQGGRWQEAAGWYQRALEALDDRPAPAPEQWHAFLNLHLVERTLGRVAGSEPWIERAEAVARELGDESARFFLDHARAQLHMARTEFDDAAALFLEALVGASTAHRPTVRLNIAECLLARGLLLDAAEEARIAEAEAISGGVDLVLPHVYRTLGRCAAAMQNPDAFVFFERALEAPGPEGENRLERAVTLQHYAIATVQFDPEGQGAAELLEAAAHEYRALGVLHFRRRWVDCFDVGSTEASGTEALQFFHD
jgi:tetratricopeptide (TPR) repeat protein